MKRNYFILTFAITGCSYAVAMTVSDLGIVLAIVGATGSTAISYILPGAYYYYTYPNAKDRYVALFLCLFGCCVVPFALTMVFVSGEGA